MLKFENECVGPCPQGCLGRGCPNRNVPRFYCDSCGQDEEPDRLYVFDDKMLCLDCLAERFDTVEKAGMGRWCE